MWYKNNVFVIKTCKSLSLNCSLCIIMAKKMMKKWLILCDQKVYFWTTYATEKYSSKY